MRPDRIFKSSALLLAIVFFGGNAFARYLEPEPMLQHPEVVAITAKRGHSLNPYSYALNNPINFSDSTGLYSWRAGCADDGPFTDRGFVINRDDVFGDVVGGRAVARVTRGGGVVGFDNQGAGACADETAAKKIRGDRVNLGDMAMIGDCWDALIKEIHAACEKEKKRTNQCSSPPDNRLPNEPVAPNTGVAQQ